MVRIEKTIEIKKSREEIWPMVSFDNLPKWMDFMEKVEWTSKDKDKVGATAHIFLNVLGIKIESDIEMTECLENEKRALRSTSEDVTATGSWTLNPIKVGTNVTVVMDFCLPHSMLGMILEKTFAISGKIIEKEIEKGLKKLKEIAEIEILSN